MKNSHFPILITCLSVLLTQMNVNADDLCYTESHGTYTFNRTPGSKITTTIKDISGKDLTSITVVKTITDFTPDKLKEIGINNVKKTIEKDSDEAEYDNDIWNSFEEFRPQGFLQQGITYRIGDLTDGNNNTVYNKSIIPFESMGTTKIGAEYTKDGKRYYEVLKKCTAQTANFSTTPYILGNRFDSWDTFRGDTNNDEIIDDKNISTKIVNQDFNLTIAALNIDKKTYNEFNGTVCSRIVKANTIPVIVLTDWKKNYFNDVNSSDQTTQGNPTFNVSKAIKKAEVETIWIRYRDINCSYLYTQNPTSLLKSTDKFAIRPKKFNISNITSPIKAGEDFNLSFEALDNSDANTTNYNEHTDDNSFKVTANEVKAGCITGDFNLSDVNFSDGSAANVDANYSEVGKITISIKDSNDSHSFANVDADDTNDSQRLIAPYDVNVTILPHHFKVDANLSNAHDGNFTYLSQDLNMSAGVDFNITAQNKQNETTTNYNSACYAKDTNFTISYENINNSLTKILYRDTSSSNLHQTNINSDIVFDKAKSIFTTESNGSAHIKLLINFDRNKSVAVNPFYFHINAINITDINNTDGNTTVDNNATFYYGRTHTLRQRYSGDNGDAFIYYEVYCDVANGGDKSLLQDKEDSKYSDDPRWFINTKHITSKDGRVKSINQRGFTSHSGNVQATTIDTQTPTNTHLQYFTATTNGYPFKTTMQINASHWLIYNKYNENATKNEFEVEFLKSSEGWAGVHETNSSTKKNAANITNRRIMW